MRLILASASPRRRELLARLGIPFDVRPVSVIEKVDSTNPVIVASRLARMKAEAARLAEPEEPILASDTVVVHAGAILGKPPDAGVGPGGWPRRRAGAAGVAEPEEPILASDTVVVHAGAILGKPRDAGEAREMLRSLRGESHRVITAGGGIHLARQ